MGCVLNRLLLLVIDDPERESDRMDSQNLLMGFFFRDCKWMDGFTRESIHSGFYDVHWPSKWRKWAAGIIRIWGMTSFGAQQFTYHRSPPSFFSSLSTSTSTSFGRQSSFPPPLSLFSPSPTTCLPPPPPINNGFHKKTDVEWMGLAHCVGGGCEIMGH